MKPDDTPAMYLNRQEIAHLTGIKIGKDGKTREQLQIAALKSLHLPHYINAAGRPVVVRTVMQGGIPAANKPKWESSVKAR